MYTNYPNTEQITQKNDSKGSTQHLGELSFSLLAEVLQVCDVMIRWILVLLFAHVKLIPRKQMLVLFTGHRHLFFLI